MARGVGGSRIGLRARGIAAFVVGLLLLGLAGTPVTHAQPADQLVINEVATGGASASDEFIEIHNPTAAELPLANVELVYVTASGATLSRRAAWPADAAPVPAGGFVLVANEAAAFAVAADVVYAAGIADAGGALVLRAIGAGTAIDAVAWGTAAGWGEGVPAPAPRPGWSIGRRTTAVGSVQDTDDNAADFVERETPTPQGASSFLPATPAPTAILSPAPAATTVPSASSTPAPAASSTPTPSASPSAPPPLATPTPMTIASARGLPDGTSVTLAGDALTGSTFHDGGGYVADDTAGVAVIVDGGAFAAGARLVLTGTVDDRFSQRTIRADAANVQVIGSAAGRSPAAVTTGLVAEPLEGTLVRIAATIRSAPTTLSAGVAFDVDDGTGVTRVVVGSSTAIDTSGWTTGVVVELVGVVGQRDSSGSGASGYRVQPRSPSDVLNVTAPGSHTPTPSASPSPVVSGSPQPSAAAAPISIAAARALAPGTRVTVRGSVTLPPGIVDAETAVIQDDSAAIVVRVDPDAAPLAAGDVVEVDGVRSTRSGMETVRATAPARVVATASRAVLRVTAAEVSERIEAQLVVVSGELPASARRAASGTVTFDVADATGVIRVVVPSSLRANDAALAAGTWVEVTGVVGQETTGAEPNAGYRIWPRSTSDVRLRATPAAANAASEQLPPADPDRPTQAGPSGRTNASLGSVGTTGLAGARVGATLVGGAWPELDVAGLLWDGEALVAVSPDSADALGVIGSSRPPVAVALGGLRLIGVEPTTGVPIVALGADPGAVTVRAAPPDAPATALPAAGAPAAWVRVVGRLEHEPDGRLRLVAGAETAAVELRCDAAPAPPIGPLVSVTGIGLGGPARLFVACDGIRVAPALVAASTADTAAPLDASPPPAVLPSSTEARPAADGRRALAAWLLALGVVAVALGTVAWRRLARTGEPDEHAEPDLHDASVVDKRVAEGADAEPTALPRRLRLVRLKGD